MTDRHTSRLIDPVLPDPPPEDRRPYRPDSFDTELLAGDSAADMAALLPEGFESVPVYLSPVERQRLINAEGNGSVELLRSDDGRLIGRRTTSPEGYDYER